MKSVGRRMEDYTERRDKIAAATWRVIEKKGLEGASMRAIAREAECTTGALVHYFDGKDEILEYALIQSFEIVQKQFDDALNHDDVIQSFRDIMMAYLPVDKASRQKMSAWQSFLAAAENNPRTREIVQDAFVQNHRRLTALLESGQKRGTVRDDASADDLADLVNAVSEGLVRITPFEADRLSAERLDSIVDLAVEMIKSDGSRMSK